MLENTNPVSEFELFSIHTIDTIIGIIASINKSLNNCEQVNRFKIPFFRKREIKVCLDLLFYAFLLFS